MKYISFLFLLGMILFPGLLLADDYCFKSKNPNDPILLERCIEEKTCLYCETAIKCYDPEAGDYVRQTFVEKNRKYWKKIKVGESGCAVPKGKSTVRGDESDVSADQLKNSSENKKSK